MQIRHMKMTISPKKEKPKINENPRITYTTPYCSHRHKTPLEAEECARHTKMKIAKMRGGI